MGPFSKSFFSFFLVVDTIYLFECSVMNFVGYDYRKERKVPVVDDDQGALENENDSDTC
jgi:hypothetical protein